LPWKLVSQKNINTTNIECNVVMTKRMPFPLDFGDIFASIPLDISDIKTKENLDIDESENFNTDV